VILAKQHFRTAVTVHPILLHGCKERRKLIESASIPGCKELLEQEGVTIDVEEAIAWRTIVVTRTQFVTTARK